MDHSRIKNSRLLLSMEVLAAFLPKNAAGMHGREALGLVTSVGYYDDMYVSLEVSFQRQDNAQVVETFLRNHWISGGFGSNFSFIGRSPPFYLHP